MPIRYPSSNNPFYPLPPDYPELCEEGKRLARVNAVACRETVADDLASEIFFQNYYLRTDEESNFEPDWYVDWVPPPQCHPEWTIACARHDRVALGASRGFAKSTKFHEFLMRDALTVPQFSGLLVKSSQDHSETALRSMARQFEENSRIVQDYGELRPGKGKNRAWSSSIMEMMNGTTLQGKSITARSVRGKRPKRILADDLEYDPKKGTSIDELIKDTDTFIFKVLLPMLRKGSALHIIGTTISRRMFLWKLITNEDADPRIDPDRWFRAFFPLVLPDGSPAWPEEYPDDEIDRKRQELGSNFGPECMCLPTSGQECALELDQTLNGYSAPDDIRACKDPLNSDIPITYHECKRNDEGIIIPHKKVVPAGELFRDMLRFATVDPIRAPGPHSDWAVVHVFGIDRTNQLWSLDLWAGKVRYHQAAQKLWEMVKKWRLRYAGVESIAQDVELRYQAMAGSDEFAMVEGWKPQIVPIVYPSGLAKEDRISALETRIRYGLLKYPFHLRNEQYHYGPLFHQTEYFTPNGNNLDHDDHIDTVAMAGWLLRERKVQAARIDSPDPTQQPIEEIARGNTVIAGMPAGSFLNIQNVDMDELMKALHKHSDTRKSKQGVQSAPGRSLTL